MVQKWPFFQPFFLFNISQENVFYDNLKGKNTFLGYKKRRQKSPKNEIFSSFWTSYLHSLERCVFVLEYRKRHFPMLYCLKKVWKIAIFGAIPWKNVNFSSFWTSCFYSLERRFFVLEYRKRHFPGLYCLKKKFAKNGHVWIKSMGQPLSKNVNFFTFWTSCFWPRKAFFFVVEYRKRHFPGLYCRKKKVEK